MPPSMRGKMWFANIFPCVEQAKKRLDNWIKLDESAAKILAFLKDNEGFIEELIQQSKIFKIVYSILKNNGFSKIQKIAIVKELSPQKNHENVEIFTENILGQE